jgi:hypothetical protein
VDAGSELMRSIHVDQTIIQEYPVIMFSEYESRHVSKNGTSEKYM